MSAPVLDLEATDAYALTVARSLITAGVPVFVAPPNPSYDSTAPAGSSEAREFLLPKGWQDTRADVTALDSWRPGWAVCMVTGHGLDGVDVDPKHGADIRQHRERLDALGVVVLGVVITPSQGAHFHVRSTGIHSGANTSAGVDYRGGDSSGKGRGFLYLPGTQRPAYGGSGYVWGLAPSEDELADLTASEDEADAVEAYLTGIGSNVVTATSTTVPAASILPAEPVPGLPSWLADELADLGTRVSVTDDRGRAHEGLRWATSSGDLTHSRSERFYRLTAMCARARLTQGQTVAAVTPWCAAVGKYAGREAAEVARVWGKVSEGTLPETPAGVATVTALHREDAPGESSTGEPEPWEDPVPLGGGTPDPVPLDGLPPVVRRMVEAVAEQSQAPTEVVLAATLGTLTAATRGAWDVHVREGWNAGPTVLWLAALADSGERKGAGTSPVLSPLVEAEKRLATEVRRANRNREAERQRLEAALKAADAEGDPTGWQRLADALHEARPRPVPGLVISDATTEALGVYLTAQGGAVGIFGTEASSFQTVAGRYDSAGGNFGLLNHAYDGESYSDLRVKRDGIRVDRPALTWSVAVQPAVMGGYADAQSEGSGFLARFILLCPESKRGRLNLRSAPVPADVAAEWHAVVTRLHAAAWERYSVMVDTLPDELGEPSRIHFTTEAAEVLVSYAEALDRAHADGDTVASLGGWAPKHPARVARLAAVFALAEDPGRRTVEAEHVTAALSIADALIGHAAAGFAIMRHASRKDPEHRLLDALRRLGEPVTTTREVYRAVRAQTSWVTSAEDVRDGLRRLADLGYVRLMAESGPGRGRPSERWEIHPSLI